ncbi:hypothetical protein [Desulfobacula sp.]|uniref:hypothetical protein n=1 Tax=Desulfobacula sp. TaxID=2593537 RepID=UPI0025BF0035|nr:hypothetical protein [Desulfobacula sp.]MBC2703783.1 hypothetical protein [Desulfobacula sp.]
MDKICPECIDEYAPEKVKCDRCNSKLIPVNEFKIKAIWPHCKKCQSAISESAEKCEKCGQSLYIIPFFPKISALIMGLAGISCAGFLLERMGASRTVMNGVAFLVGVIIWGVLNKQNHVTKKEGDIAWTKISQKSKFNFRKKKRDAMG